MKNGKLLLTITGAALLGVGLVATTVDSNILGANNNIMETAQASTRYRIRLRHNSAYYNRRGKRILGRKYVKRNTTLTAYGSRMIRHRRYYNIGRGRYLKATNAYRVANKKNFRRLRSGDYEFQILVKSAVYNNKGRHLKLNYINKGTYVYGKQIVTIKGVQFVDLGYGQYIKRANTRTFFVRGHAPSGHKGGTAVNPGYGHSNNHKSNTSHNNTGKTNHDNSGNNNSNHNFHVPTVGDNDLNHVNELVVQKLNAIRVHAASEVGTSPAFKLRPYKTNSEMQSVANLRAREATITHAHTRPDGSPMDAAQYKKLFPYTCGLWTEPGHEELGTDAGCFGECLGGVNAKETDEDMAETIVNAFSSDEEHQYILNGSYAPYAYVAVGFYWVSSAKSYSVAFEQVGGTRPPYRGNDWK